MSQLNAANRFVARPGGYFLKLGVGSVYLAIDTHSPGYARLRRR